MSHTRIKICGITRESDALQAEALGVDALGFVLVERSKRYVNIARARELSRCLGPFITRTILFLDPEPSQVEQVLQEIPEALLQFHGTESAEFCDQYQRPYIKSIGLGEGMPGPEVFASYQNAVAFLFDSNAPGQLGGTGHAFDWKLVDGFNANRLVLAGGLGVDNVADAVASLQPAAVDVSSGVEASPGIKDPRLMARFVAQVRATGQTVSL